MDNHALLRAFVKVAGGQASVASKLGVTRPYVSLLVGGHRLPSLRVAIAIERMTASWEASAWKHGPIRTSLWIPPTASTMVTDGRATGRAGASDSTEADEAEATDAAA